MKINGIEDDLLEQFKGKINIKVVCEAINRQMSELAEAFNEILLYTDLNNASGKQLDYIGDIVCLTRAQAALLTGKDKYFDTTDDEWYRRYLKYKAIVSSSSCTYYDLTAALREIVGSKLRINYKEDESLPATIVLSFEEEGDMSVLDEIPSIKPAGVNVSYSVSPSATIEISHTITYYRREQIYCGTIYCGTYPPKTD